MAQDDEQDEGDLETMTAIHFDAELRAIKSMSDHTYNVTLNIPEYNLEQVQELMGMLGDMVGVAMVEVQKSDDKKGEYGGRLK